MFGVLGNTGVWVSCQIKCFHHHLYFKLIQYNCFNLGVNHLFWMPYWKKHLWWVNEHCYLIFLQPNVSSCWLTCLKLPTSGSRGCTAAVVELVYNSELVNESTHPDEKVPVYKGEVEFITLWIKHWQNGQVFFSVYHLDRAIIIRILPDNEVVISK